MSNARMNATALVPGVETNLRAEPIQPVEHGLLIESVSRVIPEDRLGDRRRCVQLLRTGDRHQSVEPLCSNNGVGLLDTENFSL